MDNLTKEKRSWNMSRIRSENSAPEKILRSWLFKKGYRFRLYDKNLPGKPDIILKKYKLIIFINGCFWHQHKRCKRATMPKTNSLYWTNKLERNVKRDELNKRLLKKFGWTVLTIWECQLRSKERDRCFKKCLEKLHG